MGLGLPSTVDGQKYSFCRLTGMIFGYLTSNSILFLVGRLSANFLAVSQLTVNPTENFDQVYICCKGCCEMMPL